MIPCLLVHKGGLFKTKDIGTPKYVGDPIMVSIFNEKQVDEIMVIDIDATRERREPIEGMIEKLAAECRMPLCYGGGVTTVSGSSGSFDSVSRRSRLAPPQSARPRSSSERPRQSAAERDGRADVRRKIGGNYEVFIENGTQATGLKPELSSGGGADGGWRNRHPDRL